MIEADKIDLKKSIAGNKLYLRRSKLNRVLISGIETFIIGIIPLSTFVLTLKNSRYFTQGYALQLLLANAAALLLAFLLFKLFTGGKRLKRIPGSSQAENKALLLRIFKALKWDVPTSNEQILIAIPNWKTQVTVLFHGPDILLNTIRFGRSQTQGMFDEGLYMHIKEKFNDYPKQTENTTASHEPHPTIQQENFLKNN